MLSSVPALKAHGPQTITATAIPTGASLPHTASLTAGNCQGAEPTANPALRPAADNHPAASRGGPPSRRQAHTPLCQQQYKNPLHNLPLSAIMKQETAKANKGRT